MKKKIAVVAVIAGLGLAGISQANGGWGKRGANYYNCPMIGNGQYAQVDPAIQEKRDTFFTDTQDLRKEMVMKQAEKQALLRGENPDPQALSNIAGELFDLRTTLRQKADEAGVVGAFRPEDGRRGFAPGKGRPGFNNKMSDRGSGSRMGRQGYNQNMNNPGYGPGYNQNMNNPGYGPGFNQNMNNPGYGPGFNQNMNNPGNGPGMTGPGGNGKNMGYRGNPGYGQGRF